MDNLDKISLLSIVILVICLVLLGFNYHGEADNNVSNLAAKSRSRGELPPGKTETLRNLISVNNIPMAEKILGELNEKFPYEGEVHMLTGDLMMRKQDPVSAMYSYREAVDLDPDYLDKKTPLFQGRKIKRTVIEAKEIIGNALSADSGDSDMKDAKKTMYYMLRRLAGSCG